MKALLLKRYGKTGQLEFADIPRPTIKPNEFILPIRISLSCLAIVIVAMAVLPMILPTTAIFICTL